MPSINTTTPAVAHVKATTPAVKGMKIKRAATIPANAPAVQEVTEAESAPIPRMKIKRAAATPVESTHEFISAEPEPTVQVQAPVEAVTQFADVMVA
jgi:hypothetical protein